MTMISGPTVDHLQSNQDFVWKEEMIRTNCIVKLRDRRGEKHLAKKLLKPIFAALLRKDT